MNINSYRRVLATALILTGAQNAAAEDPSQDAVPPPQAARMTTQVANPIFGFTHLLPSPLTLKGGRLALGTEIAYGIFDSVQVETDLVRDFFQVFNGTLKANVVNTHPFSLAVLGTVETYNYKTLDSSNPNLRVTAFQPGLVAGVALLDDVAVFAGGNLSISSQTPLTNGVATSGYVQGAQGEADISWAYHRGKRGIQNALAAGASYDFSYKLAGFGLSHYWRGFHLGVHYYPKANQQKFLPIIAGGAVMDL